jgi:rod shape-determining protein MreC
VSPRRARFLAVVVFAGQLFLLTVRAPDRGGDAANLLAGETLRAIAPVVGLVGRVSDRVAAAGRAERTRVELEADNERLRRELATLRRERLRSAGLEEEVDELSRALDYARTSGQRLIAADVVYLDRTSWLRSLVVRVGDYAPHVDQPVVAEAGVVGRVILASGDWAKVQLLTDRAAAVGVQLEGARRQGVAHGGDNGELEVDYIPRQVEVKPGDRVTTAGIDGVYPRGLPVGVVVAVEPGSEMFHRIRVRPAVEPSQLSVVYLLDYHQPPVGEGADGTR